MKRLICLLFHARKHLVSYRRKMFLAGSDDQEWEDVRVCTKCGEDWS